jgi:putative inorganic carbon (hco3(-)) transporter
MNSLWGYLTLSHLAPYRWWYASYLSRLTGLLHPWQRGSLLLTWGDEIAVALIALVFGIAPFVPNATTGVLLAACAGFWVLLSLCAPREQIGRLTPVHLLVVAFTGIAVLATGLSPVRSAAAVGLSKLLLYLLFFALVERVVRVRRWRSVLIAAYLHVALIVGIYGIRQWLFGAEALATWTDPESNLYTTTRVYSYLGNPNLLAGYILPAIPLGIGAMFAWRGWLPKLLATVMTSISTLCLVFTFSRGGWMGLVASLLVFALLLLYWLLPYLPRFWRVWAFPILLGGVGSVVLLAVLFVAPVRDRVMSIFVGGKDSSNNFRLNVWAAVQEMIRARPVLGIGPGNTAFNLRYPLYQRPGFTALSAYSIYLELLVEVGVIGFAVFSWLLFVVLQRGWVQLQRLREDHQREGFWLIAALSVIVGMLIHGTVDTIWYRPEVATLWWFMVAIVTSYGSGPSKLHPHP